MRPLMRLLPLRLTAERLLLISPSSDPTAGSRLSEVDLSKALSLEALLQHDDWGFIREAVDVIYEQGAHAVFLFGSALRDPAAANDLDFLVSGMSYEAITRVERQDDRLWKDTDICLFDPDSTAQRPFVARNLPNSYHISKDGTLSLATTWLSMTASANGGGGGGGGGGGVGGGGGKPCFSDEIEQRLKDLQRHIKALKKAIKNYYIMKGVDDDEALNYCLWGGNSVVSAWVAWEKMATRICLITGNFVVPKSENSHEMLVATFKDRIELRGVLPAEVASQFCRKSVKGRGRDGELTRLRKNRNEFAKYMSEQPFLDDKQQRIQMRRLTQFVADLEQVHAAFADALEAGKFDTEVSISS